MERRIRFTDNALVNLFQPPMAKPARPSYYLSDEKKHNKILGFFQQQKINLDEGKYKGLAEFLFPQRKPRTKKS